MFVTSKRNNDSEPVKKWECTHLSDILNKEGKDAVDISILTAYEEGLFQSSPSINNKWTVALRELRQMPEYEKFNWRNSNYKDDCPIQAARKSEEFKAILKKALSVKPKLRFSPTQKI